MCDYRKKKYDAMDKNTQFDRMFNAEMILVKANNCKYKYDTEQNIKKRNTIKCHQTDVEQKNIELNRILSLKL